MGHGDELGRGLFAFAEIIRRAWRNRIDPVNERLDSGALADKSRWLRTIAHLSLHERPGVQQRIRGDVERVRVCGHWRRQQDCAREEKASPHATVRLGLKVFRLRP